MYLICDGCGYTLDAKPYGVGQDCPKCHKGKLREMTEEDERRLRGFPHIPHIPKSVLDSPEGVEKLRTLVAWLESICVKRVKTTIDLNVAVNKLLGIVDRTIEKLSEPQNETVKKQAKPKEINFAKLLRR